MKVTSRSFRRMSIPPLVCSTPPPPDQCEEDKDSEDFDIQYSLSQEDDDESNVYDYSNFSSYNHFESATSANKKLNIVDNINKCDGNNTTGYENNTESDSSEFKNDSLLRVSTACESEPKCDEDINIEDLGLKVNSESMCSDINDNEEHNKAHNNNIESLVKDLRISNITSNIIIDNVDSCILQQPEEENNITISNDLDLSVEDAVTEEQSVGLETDEMSVIKTVSEHEILTNKPIETPKRKQNESDDDFDEFDDFQFVEPEHKPTNIFENCDNPWENNAIEKSDFGNFTANFETNESKLEESPKIEVGSNAESHESDNVKQRQSYSDDDNFGDFDDFHSCAIVTNNATTEVSLSSQQVHMFNLQSSDTEHQVIDNINKVLSSLFAEEISEPETEFKVTLEALLSETWGHLMETDVRQPYTVTWNNSLGQKSLLKALCIDSRNILFGPKWSYNMPKYAANLSSAPLQPQKQQAASNTPQNEVTNSSSNVSDWNDPFTSDGQESCNIENESAVAENNLHDKQVFESSSSKKSDKIYSSTLNIQQLRQINLPDTHIFTPTDSETPRSKTIHYDRGPPVLLPQSVMENSVIVENSSIQEISDTVKKAEEDAEYWEFQDFKSTPEANTAIPNPISHHQEEAQNKKLETVNSDHALTKPKMVYQTQVLLPIKMEPILPTLNWPDPGEVKETFDDFADFLSHSSWSNEKPDTSHTTVSQENKIKSNINTDTLSKIINKDNITRELDVETSISTNSCDFDDDFDTFKSALPSNYTTVEFKCNSSNNETVNNVPTQNISSQIASSQLPDFNCIFPKMNDKSDTISITNSTRPNAALTHNLGYITNTTEPSTNHISILSGIQTPSNFLQPMSANSTNISQNQQKCAQILQPLSLESYSQINWPSPGIDLQDLSRFNPVETLQSLKTDLSVSHKGLSPIHNQKINNLAPDDDVWGEFVSSKPKQQQSLSKKSAAFVDDDEWTDFVSSPSVKPQNGLMNTISLNVHTNSNMQKSTNQNKYSMKSNKIPLDIPTLNYITPKANNHKSYNDKHFQNL